MTSAELTPGQTFGGYRIQHLLGRGGMGAVYAAEQVEDGRLVAVKVLAAGLERAEDRERFLREGRTAASVNHPNTVYVYRTEEIDGRPTIAMELVEGGTLEQKVEAQGPLSMADAITDTLQLIDGLEAAHRRGILHRDIKPANCFIGRDGVVKVGDFGLSRPVDSVEQGRLTQTGLFLGTPVFSSPEQLMGEALDVRADIYAVGATLYYLLTGKLPFDADNAVKLIAVVMSGTPTPLAQYRPDVPAALAAVVTKCLARSRDERFPDYAALRTALLACRPAELTAAPLVRRLGAGIIDSWLISIPALPLVALLKTFGIGASMTVKDPRYQALQAVMTLPFELLVYGVLEGLTGWTPAKRVLGLRTLRDDGAVPGLAKAMLRGLCVSAPGVLAVLVALLLGAGKSVATGIVMTVGIGGSLALFARARASNGWRAEHDRLTGTRVVMARAASVRERSVTPEARMLPVHHALRGRVGSYDLTGAIDANETLLLASDGALQRPVWIVRRPIGSAPLTDAERQASRVTCARWIGGRRADDEAWDAYAAIGGTALSVRLTQGVTWRASHAWLADVLDELRARRDAGSAVQGLTIDDVLITDDGHAVVLPFRLAASHAQVPDAAAADAAAADAAAADASRAHATSSTSVSDAGSLPASIARQLEQSVRGAMTEWPLRAQRLIAAMRDPLVPLDRLQELLTAAGAQREPLTRTRRLQMALGTAAPLVLIAAVSFYATYIVAPRDPALDRLEPLLGFLADTTNRSPEQGATRELVAVYIAGHLRETIVRHRAGADSTIDRLSGINTREWHIADSVERAHPTVDPAQLAEADRVVDSQWGGRPPGRPDIRVAVPLITLMVMFGVGACCTLLTTLFARRGVVLRVMGLEFVTATGSEAGRMRLLWRQLVAWVPWGLLVSGLAMSAVGRGAPRGAVPALVVGGVLAVISVIIAWRTPARGLAERLSGTRLVPE